MNKINLEKKATKPLSKEHLKVWLKLLTLNKVITNELRENLYSQYGTTLPRFDVMATLHRFQSGLKMSELSSVLKVSNGNVTNIIDRLVEDGLVTREVNTNDRRSFTVKLSEKGHQEFEQQAVSHEAWIHNLFKDLSIDQCENFIDNINAILAERENAG